MKQKNGIQFAVVREDPLLDLSVFKLFNVKNPILIGSGGCTAFCISAQYPGIPIHLIEPNPAQVQLMLKKIRVLKTFPSAKKKEAFSELIECGNFESLFRQFRNFIFEFVIAEKDFEKLIHSSNKKQFKELFNQPYWSVAFQLFFSNSILETMFGPAAIQHAPKGSYPIYFRSVIEKGLLRCDSGQNYFLYHIFLGRYPKRGSSLPLYLQKTVKDINVQFFPVMADQVRSYSSYDFVGLSNIFDWSSDAEVKRIAKKLTLELRPGSVVMFRQLNNQKNFEKMFGPAFRWQHQLQKDLIKTDRSLFYSSVHIGVKK